MDIANPTVSVIVPNYNHAKFLRQRIDSILDQTYQDFELIILDDFSTDDSKKIINDYSSCKKVSHIVYNESNTGSPFLQWNKGFSLAKGKYIWIAESDDYSDAAFLQKMLLVIEEEDNCNVAFCCSHLVDEDGHILPLDWDRNRESKGAVNKFEGKSFVKARMLLDNSIYNAGMALFRRSALEKVDKQYMNFLYCGDWYFWYNICINGTVIRYCDKLNYFRQHTEKVTPRAEAEGIKFMEGKYVFNDIMKTLDFTPLQRKSAIGKFMKRIIDFKLFKNKYIKKNVLKDTKKYFNSSYSYIFIYEIDKLFNFSALDLKKNNFL